MVYRSINRLADRYFNYTSYYFRSISTKFDPFLLLGSYNIINLESLQERTYNQRSYNVSFNLFCNKHNDFNVYTNSIINGCCNFFNVSDNLVDTQKDFHHHGSITKKMTFICSIFEKINFLFYFILQT
jgi:hypothetical protein